MYQINQLIATGDTYATITHVYDAPSKAINVLLCDGNTILLDRHKILPPLDTRGAFLEHIAAKGWEVEDTLIQNKTKTILLQYHEGKWECVENCPTFKPERMRQYAKDITQAADILDILNNHKF